MTDKIIKDSDTLVLDFIANISKLEQELKNCPDIIRRKVTLKIGKEGYFFYIQGLADTNLIQRDFISNVLNLESLDFTMPKYLQDKIPVAGISFPVYIKDIVSEILNGKTIFIGNDINYAIACDLKKYNKRDITEPQTEKVVRGGHDGFIEDIVTNIAILRTKIKNSNLKFIEFTVGKVTNQKLVVAYLDNIANKNILKILCNKISKLNFDGFIGSGYIEHIITDHPMSPFPQYLATERADKATAALLEGKFVIILDGTPVTIIAPVNIFSFFQATDDYTTSWISGSIVRFGRIFACFIALFLPGIYIALLTFHYYMIPLTLLVPLAESRARVPFTPIVEGLIMEFVIELIRESAIRLPTYIGASIGVVGGIIIGQAAVQAGIVSNLMVIIVSVTAIAAFAIPNYDMSLTVRIIRFAIMIFAAIFGIVGIIVPIAFLIYHVIILESLGEPYLQPIAPLKFRDFKDTFFIMPIRFLKKRPDIAKPIDNTRVKNDE